jgi:ectoine hydroxylase-related dioxygenase (phytanoyl-CoA dioxygenase family)
MDFNIYGFTLERSFIHLDELREVENILQRILDEESSFEYYENGVLIRIENFIDIDKRLRDILLNSAIMDKLESFFGEPATLFKDKINFKYPGGVPDDLHQDVQAKWDSYGTEAFITVGFPLDDCTVETSCVYFYNKQMENRRRMLGEYSQPLSWDAFEKEDFVPLIAFPGDVSFHDVYVPHYSEAQKSKKQRRVIWLTFNAASSGDFREKYYADKLESYPPNNRRKKGVNYEYKV